MNLVESAFAHCPYCGEPLELLIDPSVEAQQYIEDCEVCCRPINVNALVHSDGRAEVRVFSENE